MNILISGSHGFIGTMLCRACAARGDRVVRLGRGIIDPEIMAGIDAVVNLAGASVSSGLWTTARKALIRESRVQGTRLLSESLARLTRPPRVLISASAVGIYSGPGFLASVCEAWERATESAARAGIRVVHARFGMVLGKNGGALKALLPIFKWGLGGRLGNGRQWISWIALNDAVSVILHAIDHDSLVGPVNVVSPHPVTNAEFTKTLGRVLQRPTFCAIPTFALRLLGEMGRELFLSSARALPVELQATGYVFQCPTLESALVAEHHLVS